jgi:hypothetical protein
MKTEQTTPREQLDLIEQAIAQAKENLSNHSYDFIFWGWLVSISAILNYVLLAYSSLGNQSYLIWPITMSIGSIGVFWYYLKREKKKSHKTHLEYFLSSLWMVLGGVLILLSLATPFVDLNPWFLFPLLVGVGTLVSGVVLKFRPLVIGGIVLLGFPFYSIFVSGSSVLLLYAAVIIVSYLVPGYLLKRHQA